jgi:hypothetical protein
MGWLNDRLRALRGLPPKEEAPPKYETLPNRFPPSLVGETRHAPHDCPTFADPDIEEKIFEDEEAGIITPYPWTEPHLHLQQPDRDSPAWQALLRLIDEAARDGREEFAPGREMEGALWHQITVLPPEIGTLTKVRRLLIYGSSLLRIPPEIGLMQNLETFDPYTSYGLHWFPYEITRCPKLANSTVSTRALYGNRKYRPPFPRLNQPEDIAALAPTHCSVCDSPLDPASLKQVWLSRLVATDVLPLLVNACSQACIDRLPPGHENYIPTPHTGGLEQQQPDHSPYHM